MLSYGALSGSKLSVQTFSSLNFETSLFAYNFFLTVAHNCHIKTKCSHQIQITHVKFKSLTANSNHSQQIKNQQIQIAPQQIKNHSQQTQIAHSKLQIHHSKLQIVHIKFKCSQQIQLAHSKYKFLQQIQNGQCKRKTSDCGLRTAD